MGIATDAEASRLMSRTDRVLRYAPVLRFSRQETHFPIDPAVFIASARLRRYGWSTVCGDAVWNPRRAGWDAVSDRVSGAEAVGLDIGQVCRLIQFEAPSAQADANRRPFDANNCWRGRRSGYALELIRRPAALRGEFGRAPALFYDRYGVSAGVGDFDVITYWFFYALPEEASCEGGWESVSVIVPDRGADQPQVRYASQRYGLTAALRDVELEEETHPVVYVAPGNHGGFRRALDLNVGMTSANTVGLRTWELPPKRVPLLGWSSFDGAWGRVGTDSSSTGPLGPLFQREDIAMIELQ